MSLLTLKWLAVFCLVLIIGCGDAGPEKTIVTVYSPHGKPILPEFEKLFETAHPTIDVQWLDMGSQDVLDRVRSERANPQGDVWWGAPATNFIQAADEGLLLPYRPTWADQLKSDFKDPQDRWYGTAQLIPVITFNNQELTEESAPQDWDDLLDSKWKDKIVIRYPLASGTMRTAFSGMIWRFYKETTSPDQGYDWLMKLDANTKDYAADPNMMFQKLARKEGIVSIWLMNDIMLQVDRYDYPFGFTIPKNGAPILTDGIGLIANSKNPDEAKLFYEFVTNIDHTVLQATEYYRIPTRTDIPKNRLPDWMANLDVTPFEVDWQVFSEQSKEWMKYWDKNIKGNG
ncbi:MAG: extracellular solute-binding protein [Gemmatimonadota bacterium]|nr:extracellular solute-binding protein [Gemmatimonadota bacterium]